jgi:hypothetical protein
LEDFVIIITKREETNNKSPIVLRTLYRGYIIILRKRNKAKASRLSNLSFGRFPNERIDAFGRLRNNNKKKEGNEAKKKQ